MLLAKQVRIFSGFTSSALRHLSSSVMDPVETGKKAAATAAVDELVKVRCYSQILRFFVKKRKWFVRFVESQSPRVSHDDRARYKFGKIVSIRFGRMLQ